MKKAVLIMAVTLVASCAEKPERVNVVTNYNEVISPQPCPDWSDSSDDLPSSNYGCATLTNYGAMVEDPNDMIRGKQSGYANSSVNTLMIGRYETGTVPALAGATSGSQ